MKGQSVVHSSSKDDWQTPQDLYDLLHKEFTFQVDRAASFANKKCLLYYGPDHQHENFRDALTIAWSGQGFLNPPYSLVGKFMAKAYAEMAINGVSTVALIAARPDTKWWHEYVAYADEIRFLKGRLRFEGEDTGNSAPFPSAVVIFRPLPIGMFYTQRVVWWDWRSTKEMDKVA